MKVQVISAVVLIVLASGCARLRDNAGASYESDMNVLTGGPVTGIRIKDLPPPVRKTLREKVPGAEIAAIDRDNSDGRIYYRINFSEPAKNRTMFITEDGTITDDVKN